jgi:uncharacterized membrane protein YjfL (UPF0719 family)
MPEPTFYLATLMNLLINLLYTIVALVVGLSAFTYLDRKLFPTIDFVEEIKKGNIAAAIFASTILLFIGILIGFALKG